MESFDLLESAAHESRTSDGGRGHSVLFILAVLLADFAATGKVVDGPL